jgi:hypothetical protein
LRFNTAYVVPLSSSWTVSTGWSEILRTHQSVAAQYLSMGPDETDAHQIDFSSTTHRSEQNACLRSVGFSHAHTAHRDRGSQSDWAELPCSRPKCLS